mmetsp:Transcript_22113/g.40647  ORF Transcript_22113/g.40647 Transcript_22113/m.40647 type:complete len:219 (+) Transcript_22113:51-707(+)
MAASVAGSEAAHNGWDQPRRFMPVQTSALPLDRARLLKRQHSTAKARQETGVVKTLLGVERDLVKSDYLAEREHLAARIRASHSDRVMRWKFMTQQNPLTVNLVSEAQRIMESSRAMERAEQREKRLLAKRDVEAHESILRRATQEHDEDAMPREARRSAYVNGKVERALAGIEKGNERTAKVLHQKMKLRARAEEVQYRRTMKDAYPDDAWLAMRTF